MSMSVVSDDHPRCGRITYIVGGGPAQLDRALPESGKQFAANIKIVDVAVLDPNSATRGPIEIRSPDIAHRGVVPGKHTVCTVHVTPDGDVKLENAPTTHWVSWSCVFPHGVSFETVPHHALPDGSAIVMTIDYAPR